MNADVPKVTEQQVNRKLDVLTRRYFVLEALHGFQSEGRAPSLGELVLDAQRRAGNINYHFTPLGLVEAVDSLEMPRRGKPNIEGLSYVSVDGHGNYRFTERGAQERLTTLVWMNELLSSRTARGRVLQRNRHHYLYADGQ